MDRLKRSDRFVSFFDWYHTIATMCQSIDYGPNELSAEQDHTQCTKANDASSSPFSCCGMGSGSGSGSATTASESSSAAVAVTPDSSTSSSPSLSDNTDEVVSSVKTTSGSSSSSSAVPVSFRRNRFKSLRNRYVCVVVVVDDNERPYGRPGMDSGAVVVTLSMRPDDLPMRFPLGPTTVKDCVDTSNSAMVDTHSNNKLVGAIRLFFTHIDVIVESGSAGQSIDGSIKPLW